MAEIIDIGKFREDNDPNISGKYQDLILEGEALLSQIKENPFNKLNLASLQGLITGAQYILDLKGITPEHYSKLKADFIELKNKLITK